MHNTSISKYDYNNNNTTLHSYSIRKFENECL